MPKNAVSEYDLTAINNSDVGGVNIAEQSNARLMNDAVRMLMSHLRAFWNVAARTDVANTFAQNVTIRNNDPILTLFDENATSGLRGWYFAGSNGTVTLNRTDDAGAFTGTVATFEVAGTGAPNVTSVMTREKGDARFAPISSSARFKDGIAPAPAADLSGVSRKSWTWGGELNPNDPRFGRVGSGLIAEDVAAVIPEAVVRDELGRPAGLDPLTLIGALKAEIDALRARVAALEASNA